MSKIFTKNPEALEIMEEYKKIIKIKKALRKREQKLNDKDGAIRNQRTEAKSDASYC